MFQRKFSWLNEPTSTNTKTNQSTPTFDDIFKIVVILDESGSMESIKGKMIDAINDLIKEQSQTEGRPATFTLVKFNDSINRVIQNKLLANVNPLTNSDYTPSGSTALCDAIGDTINWFRNEKNVLMVIVTDGQENASRQYNKSQITRMIEEKKKNNEWSYVYLSSDLSTFQQGDTLGLQKSAYATNSLIKQSDMGNYISNNLNVAIGNYRKKGITVQSQLNTQ